MNGTYWGSAGLSVCLVCGCRCLSILDGSDSLFQCVTVLQGALKMSRLTIGTSKLIPLIAEVRKPIDSCLCSRRISGKITFQPEDNPILWVLHKAMFLLVQKTSRMLKESANSTMIRTL